MSVKNQFLRLFTPIFAGTVFLVASCDSSNPASTDQAQNDLPEEDVTTTALAVMPPLPNIDVPFTTYKVPVSKGMTIETETGTTIEIPADAFVDQNGNPIAGEVAIKFREFHDAKDIIASGIPMHKPETGEYMETAGMFEIKGEHDGSEVFIRGDKDVQVNLASYNEGEQFNFYRLGPKDCRWQDKGTAKPQSNKKKEARLAVLDSELPKPPVKPVKQSDVENFVFNLDVNYSMFPELKPFKSVVWEYAGKGKDPEKNEWIFSANWDKISLNKSSTGYFELVLSDSDKKFKTLVRPVLDEDNYEDALALFTETKLKAYNDIKEKQKAERERLAKQANLMRSFAISDFGIYNWDVWHRPGRINCHATPKFDELAKLDNDINKGISYFLVTQSERSVVRYSAHDLSKFSFDPSKDNVLIAVLPEGKVAVFSAYNFKELDLVRINSNKTALLQMATYTYEINSLDDLNKVVEHGLLS